MNQLGNKSNSRKIAILVVIACSSLLSFHLSAVDYSRTKKELTIMTGIFETSLSEAKKSRRHRSFISARRGVESTYLANQGMVFSFSFKPSYFVASADWGAFGDEVSALVESVTADIFNNEPVVVTAPSLPSFPKVPMPDGDWEKNAGAYELEQEAMQALRDAQRQKREEIRELQRSVRELERQARREKDDSKKVRKNKQALEKKMAALANKMETYKKKIDQYTQKKQTAIKKSNQHKSDLILTTLCDYGRTMRSLKKNEHITLVFKNFENNLDLIQVFSIQDIKNCTSQSKLAKKAIRYTL
ncbi:MAG: hypothetical protein Q9M92_03490 [Enterobacterales bacterium]|nr:hypothetical protein [Enterobacterales bacterium]